MDGYLLGNVLTSVSDIGYRPAENCLLARSITGRTVQVPAVVSVVALLARRVDRA